MIESFLNRKLSWSPFSLFLHSFLLVHSWNLSQGSVFCDTETDVSNPFLGADEVGMESWHLANVKLEVVDLSCNHFQLSKLLGFSCTICSRRTLICIHGLFSALFPSFVPWFSYFCLVGICVFKSSPSTVVLACCWHQVLLDWLELYIWTIHNTYHFPLGMYWWSTCQKDCSANLNRCRDRGIVLLISLEENEHVHFCTKTSFELNCTSKSFSCHFLDLAVNQSPQGRSCDIFDKLSQPEYAVVFWSFQYLDCY